MIKFDTLGDKISLQYGGSKAHHDFNKGSKLKWAIPEMVTAVKRHLANNFTDPLKQNAMNLFLGMFDPQKEK